MMFSPLFAAREMEVIPVLSVWVHVCLLPDTVSVDFILSLEPSARAVPSSRVTNIPNRCCLPSLKACPDVIVGWGGCPALVEGLSEMEAEKRSSTFAAPSPPAGNSPLSQAARYIPSEHTPIMAHSRVAFSFMVISVCIFTVVSSVFLLDGRILLYRTPI